ncbi:uncharacterized membrane protein YhaH (DUF805 family) [Sagittula marina]|uniref:Uncharacterized membrane protein YhaH (DUF805 family) n=1 Tax=Sagittula marina TaxID=943940 RepID=A0A7W6DKJ3_9RHOB|nr:DUF805 domain-containing protein [Sagittula marina]MBB3984758.1 uncharacterized membrane protein YhaH (DUF805 family) [Sagittula marina]
MVPPHTAFARFFTRALDFSGRSSRAEFWWAQTLFLLILVSLVAANLVSVMHTGVMLPGFLAAMPIISPLLMIPQLSSQARRLHDTGRSALWLLVGLVPLIGGAILLVMFALPSDRDNRFGPAPDEDAARTMPTGLSDTAEPAAKRSRKRNRRPTAWDGYAMLTQLDLPPSPQMQAARKAEVSDYYRRNILKKSEIPAG